MKIQLTTYTFLLVASATALTGLASAAFSADASSGPDPVHEKGIQYVSGGIGLDEEEALKSQAQNYNLHVSDATKSGDFVADVNFVVKSKDGHQLISARDSGPLFFAQLPAGDYVIQAYGDGQEQTREVKVSANRPTDIHFIWKTG